jgi:ribosome-binding factor A
MPGPKRAVRVAEQLRAALAEILAREISDPRLAGVVVTRVEITDDLGMVTARIRMLEGGDDAAVRKATINALYGAKTVIKRQLVARVRMRTVPDIRFFYDEGQDRQTRVEELLREIEVEKKN